MICWTETKNPRLGSSADDLWKELGIHDDITATAIKRAIAIQIEMSSQNRVDRAGKKNYLE